MNVELTKPELERFIRQQVEAGRYTSPAEVIEAGLAQLMIDASLEELDDDTLNAISAAESQIEKGEYRDWKEASAQLRRTYLSK